MWEPAGDAPIGNRCHMVTQWSAQRTLQVAGVVLVRPTDHVRCRRFGFDGRRVWACAGVDVFCSWSDHRGVRPIGAMRGAEDSRLPGKG